jgi:hypothetical protein
LAAVDSARNSRGDSFPNATIFVNAGPNKENVTYTSENITGPTGAQTVSFPMFDAITGVNVTDNYLLSLLHTWN